MADALTRLRHYQQVFQQDPTSLDFIPLARCYLQQGLTDAANDLLRRGLQQHPNQREALLLLGQVLLQRDEPDEARTLFEQVLSRVPDCAEAMLGLARLDGALGHLQRAQRALQQAQALLGSTHPEVVAVRDLLQQATAFSDPVMEQGPFVNATLVDLYLRQGLTEKAQAALSLLIQQQPDNPRWRDQLSQLQGHQVGDGFEQPVSVSDNPSGYVAALTAWLKAIERRRRHV
ncbi:tetratricopeptide repeat protein [Desulfuromonas thiophila]|uniref:tetratricopeptide repeat protein n=1 Tax=Desulfuromonas thiophila TaxID=57664 RepID=UPI0024A8AA39|nr:tetratricopeptide repeat protein [Desulfuromonas thiophila]